MGLTPEETFIRARLAEAIAGHGLIVPVTMGIIDNIVDGILRDPSFTSVILDFLQEQQNGELERWATLHVNLFTQASQFVRRAKLVGLDTSLPPAIRDELLALSQSCAAIEELNKQSP